MNSEHLEPTGHACFSLLALAARKQTQNLSPYYTIPNIIIITLNQQTPPTHFESAFVINGCINKPRLHLNPNEKIQ